MNISHVLKILLALSNECDWIQVKIRKVSERGDVKVEVTCPFDKFREIACLFGGCWSHSDSCKTGPGSSVIP